MNMMQQENLPHCVTIAQEERRESQGEVGIQRPWNSSWKMLSQGPLEKESDEGALVRQEGQCQADI